MNTTPSPCLDNSAAASIDLLQYINALVDARWWLLVAALVSGLLTGLWAYSQPYMYQSSIKVAVVDIEDPGGVSPDDRRASEVLTLVEHGFVMGTTRDNYNDVMMARLVSRDFTMRFLDELNIYRLFYPEQWNKDEQTWVDGFTPDRGESFTRFRDEVRSVEHDEETDIITVKINWVEAVVARDVANQYVSAFNEFIREKTELEVQRKQAFLHEELRRSDIVDIQQSIYRLIEAQTAIAMLTSAREEYALEIIDPAATPYKSFNVSRKRKVLLGMIVGTMLAVFTVFGLVLVRAMLQTVLAYREMQGRENSAQDNKIAFENGDN
jgi:hypothetical protein